MIFRLFRNYFRKRDEKRWREWNDVISQLYGDYRLSLVKIVSIRQKARTGTKAYVHRYDNIKKRHAIWIPNYWPSSGNYVLGRGGYGHGDHHHEEVFFFNDVIKIVHCNVYRGYIKHQKRINLNKSSDA